MQIYEVKNDTADILYASDENSLFLSDFLFIEDDNSTIVSQVTNINTTQQTGVNIATVKFYLSVDKSNRLTPYNGHTPSKNSEVGFLDSNEIIGLFKPKYNAINWGVYSRDENYSVSTDLKFLSSGCCIISDRHEQTSAIVKNLVDSLQKTGTKLLLLDFEGEYKKVNASLNLKYGSDFRIPLNSYALDFIFENDLNDCPIEARAIIQGIILEIQKYVESVDEKFIPFETFLEIILSEAKSSSNAGLMIFANKLMKYKQKNLFADLKKHFSVLNDCKSSVKLDLTSVDEKFYSLILNSVISGLEKKFYVISDIPDDNIEYSTIKNIYEKQNIRLIPVLRHDNRFLTKIKSNCSNMAIFAPVVKQNSGEAYGSFLDKLTNDEFILWGENTLSIPLIASLKATMTKLKEELQNDIEDDISLSDLDDLDKVNITAIKEVLKQEKLQNEITEDDLDSISDNSQTVIQSDISCVSENNPAEENTIQENVILEDSDTASETDEFVENELPQSNIENEDVVVDEPSENFENENAEISQNDEELSASTPIIEQQEDTVEPVQEKAVEQDVISQEEPIENNPSSQIQQVPLTQPSQQPSSQVNDTLPVEQSPVEIRVKKEEESPVPVRKAMPNASEIPVYEPKEPENQQQENFDEGCRVSHAKYGMGTVEKVIKYGKKMLCSIQFDKVGRRLLDPNITILEKI